MKMQQRFVLSLMVLGALATTTLGLMGCTGQSSELTNLPNPGTTAVDTESTSESVDSSQGESANPVEKNDDADMLASIAECGNVFDLYEMKEEYAQRENPTAAVTEALAKKWDELTASFEPQEIITDHVDFLTFAMRQSKEDGKCYGWWLFKVRAAMEKDYTMQLLGYVDESNLEKIPQRFRDWGYNYHP